MCYIFFVSTLQDAEKAISELTSIVEKPQDYYDVAFVLDCRLYYPQLPTYTFDTKTAIEKVIARLAELTKACNESDDPQQYFEAHLHTVFLQPAKG